MKINIKKFIGILAFATLLSSCDTTNESGYLPADYAFPTTFTLTEDTATDNSFIVSYASSSAGKGYYVSVQSGTAAPTSTQVHSGIGFLQSGSFDVDGTTTTDITLDTDIYGGYDYDVYAIHKSGDNFISETATKLTVTTPDTANPVFLRENSNPSFTAAGINPFAPVTFTFTEPVFYQGGDITFTAFGSGRTIIVNDPSALSMSGTSISVDTHGTFEQDDFIIVTWADGTFNDNSGKSVAALGGFSHYFSTRLFNVPESAFLMQGTWEYSTVFYGALGGFYSGNASFFLPDTGSFELKLDPSDPEGLTLLGVNIFAPLAQLGSPTEPEFLKIKIGANGTLAVLPAPQPSGINGGGVFEWTHWSFMGTPYPGFYDVSAGEINHWLQLVSVASGAAIDDMDYNYTRVGTFAKADATTVKNLEKRNQLLKDKETVYKSYKKSKLEL
jgi:hypothetical protein